MTGPAAASGPSPSGEAASAARAVFAVTRRRRLAAGHGDAALSPSGRLWLVRGALAARRHWLAGALLAAGLVLRVLALIAYRPALIYVDSLKYLYGASPGSEPLGYAVLLRPLGLAGTLTTVAALQHLLGLATAVALYVVLLRRGVARWLAAVAAAPVLLDAYQLQMEQMIMPDTWFEAMIVAGLAVLLWRPAVTVPYAVAAGLILGLSATFKQLGEVLLVPAVLYLLAAGDGWRARLRPAAALLVAFLLPILAYCTVSDVRTGHFWLARSQTDTGRLMAAADCATLKVPREARLLCPTPAEQAHGPDWLEHSGKSPLAPRTVPLPPATGRETLIGILKSAVIGQQPLRVAVSIGTDALRLFAVTRQPSEWVTPISRWQFQDGYPTHPPWVSLGRGNVIIVGVQKVLFGRFHIHPLKPGYGGTAQVDRPVAAFLRSYQLGGGYTPGPLLAVFTLAGLAGSALALARRGRANAGRDHRLRAPALRTAALACLLFTVTAAAALLPPDVYEFSWRYQLPAVITLPPAGVLGVTALVSYVRGRRAAREEPGTAAADAR